MGTWEPSSWFLQIFFLLLFILFLWTVFLFRILNYDYKMVGLIKKRFKLKWLLIVASRYINVCLCEIFLLLLVSVLNVSANKTYDCHINFFFERENDREKERERERVLVVCVQLTWGFVYEELNTIQKKKAITEIMNNKKIN